MCDFLTLTREGRAAGAVAGGIISAGIVLIRQIPSSVTSISLLTQPREGRVAGAVAGGIILTGPVVIMQPIPASVATNE